MEPRSGIEPDFKVYNTSTIPDRARHGEGQDFVPAKEGEIA